MRHIQRNLERRNSKRQSPKRKNPERKYLEKPALSDVNSWLVVFYSLNDFEIIITVSLKGESDGHRRGMVYSNIDSRTEPSSTGVR